MKLLYKKRESQMVKIRIIKGFEIDILKIPQMKTLQILPY